MKRYKFLKDYEAHKKGAIVELADTEAEALVTLSIIEEISDDAEFDEVMDKALAGFSTKLAQAASGAVSKAIEGLSLTVEDGVPISIGKDHSLDEPIPGYTKEGRNFGHWAKDVRLASAPTGATQTEALLKYQEKRNQQIKAATGMNEAIQEEGGIMVPELVANEIYRKAFAENDIMSRTSQRQVPGNNVTYRSLVENSRAAGQRHGGVRGYWLGEGDQFTKSKPKYTPIKFELHKLGVFVYVTDELLEDASGISLQQELTELASLEIAFQVGDALTNGNGQFKPTGYVPSGSEGSSVLITRGTANTVKQADITAMYARLHSPLRAGAVWLANQEIEPQLDVLFLPFTNVAGSENVGGFPLYMPPGGIADTPYGRLKGRPVIMTEFAAALGTTGDLALINLGEYRTVTKTTGIQTAMSIHLRFDYDESVFRFVFRIDGHSMWPSPVTPYKGTDTVSHSIVLAVAA